MIFKISQFRIIQNCWKFQLGTDHFPGRPILSMGLNSVENLILQYDTISKSVAIWRELIYIIRLKYAILKHIFLNEQIFRTLTVFHFSAIPMERTSRLYGKNSQRVCTRLSLNLTTRRGSNRTGALCPFPKFPSTNMRPASTRRRLKGSSGIWRGNSKNLTPAIA